MLRFGQFENTQSIPCTIPDLALDVKIFVGEALTLVKCCLEKDEKDENGVYPDMLRFKNGSTLKDFCGKTAMPGTKNPRLLDMPASASDITLGQQLRGEA